MAKPKKERDWPYLLAYSIIILVAIFWPFFTQLFMMSFESLFLTLFLIMAVLMFSYAKKLSAKLGNPMLSNLYALGLGFTLTGVATTLLVLASVPTVSKEIREYLNMFLQISLNFLLAGAGLIGASLSTLISQRGQQGGQQPQSSCGGCQQSK